MNVDLYGTVEPTEDGYVLRFERVLGHPLERVWRALTEPEELAHWLAPAEFELAVGGRAYVRFSDTDISDSTVRAVVPPVLLEFGFNDVSDDVVRFELTPEGEGTRLVLTHWLRPPGERFGTLGGWHDHLERLEAHLGGAPSPQRPGRWQELRDGYAAVDAAATD